MLLKAAENVRLQDAIEFSCSCFCCQPRTEEIVGILLCKNVRQHYMFRKTIKPNLNRSEKFLYKTALNGQLRWPSVQFYLQRWFAAMKTRAQALLCYSPWLGLCMLCQDPNRLYRVNKPKQHCVEGSLFQLACTSAHWNPEYQRCEHSPEFLPTKQILMSEYLIQVGHPWAVWLELKFHMNY